MDEENMSFEDLLNSSMEKQNKKLGKVVTGKVISVSNNGEIFLDIDYKADGIIPKNEFSFDENENPKDSVKPGDIITCTVLKMNDGLGNVLLSCKKQRSFEKKKQKEDTINSFWDNVKVGDKFKGTVSSISSYGAFVNLNEYVSGLLHVSEITWEKNVKPQDLLKVGQEIDVTIREVDKDNKRMQLSYVGKGANPWDEIGLTQGDVVDVKIKHLVQFGAFAEVKKGVEGLIHISQISMDRISNPNEKLKVGDVVKAKIIELDIPNRKMELSIKELEREALQEKKRQEKANRVVKETQIAEGISFVGEYKEDTSATEEGNENNE